MFAQYVLVKVQLVIWFQTSLSHEGTWNLHVAVPCKLHPRNSLTQGKEELLTSHLKKLGDSLTCLLQDCLSIPHLS